jgi:hypothetical protein
MTTRFPCGFLYLFFCGILLILLEVFTIFYISTSLSGSVYIERGYFYFLLTIIVLQIVMLVFVLDE